MADLYEFTVEWPSTSAQSVTVTGDFDQWAQSLPLSRSPSNNHFTATIKVPYGCPTRYKFIVDGKWQVKQEEPTEYSPEGFLNNVCYVPLKPPQELSAGNGNADGENLGRKKRSSATAGQFVKVLKDTITAREGTSSALGYVASGIGETVRSVVGVDPINVNQIAIPTPTTPNPSTALPSPTPNAVATGPTNGDAVRSPESDTEPADNSVAPIVPITIVPVYARENCTIDPTKVVPDEESIGTFVGVSPPPKDDEAKEEEEKEEENNVLDKTTIGAPPGLPVILTSSPSPPEESQVTTGEVPKEKPVVESTAEENIPAPVAEEIKPEEPVPAPASASTPAPAIEPATPSSPKNANGSTPEDPTTVKSSPHPTTPTTPPAVVAESVASTPTSTFRKSKVFPSKNGSANEFDVGEGKGTASRKKRTSSIFGSLKKLFHHEKEKEKGLHREP